LDTDKALPALVGHMFLCPIRVCWATSMCFSSFGIPEVWREAFDDARHRVQRALAQQVAQREPYEAFVRLYTLRNKVMHSQPYQYAHAGAVAAELDPRKAISMYCKGGAAAISSRSA